MKVACKVEIVTQSAMGCFTSELAQRLVFKGLVHGTEKKPLERAKLTLIKHRHRWNGGNDWGIYKDDITLYLCAWQPSSTCVRPQTPVNRVGIHQDALLHCRTKLNQTTVQSVFSWLWMPKFGDILVAGCLISKIF